MDPRQLFPWLALFFAVLALVARWRQRRWQGAARIWLWLAFCFAAVGLWLRVAG